MSFSLTLPTSTKSPYRIPENLPPNFEVSDLSSIPKILSIEDFENYIHCIRNLNPNSDLYEQQEFPAYTQLERKWLNALHNEIDLGGKTFISELFYLANTKVLNTPSLFHISYSAYQQGQQILKRKMLDNADPLLLQKIIHLFINLENKELLLEKYSELFLLLLSYEKYDLFGVALTEARKKGLDINATLTKYQILARQRSDLPQLKKLLSIQFDGQAYYLVNNPREYTREELFEKLKQNILLTLDIHGPNIDYKKQIFQFALQTRDFDSMAKVITVNPENNEELVAKLKESASFFQQELLNTLEKASILGEKELVNFLLDGGFEFNEECISQAFINAIMYGNEKIAAKLLETQKELIRKENIHFLANFNLSEDCRILFEQV